MGSVEQVADGLVTGLYARLAALESVPAEVDSLQASFAAAGTSLPLLCLQIVLVVAAVLGTFVLADRWFRQMPAWGGAWRRFLALVIAAALALVIGFIAARLLGGAGLPLRTLRLWAVVAVVGPIIVAILRTVLMASRPSQSPARSGSSRISSSMVVNSTWKAGSRRTTPIMPTPSSRPRTNPRTDKHLAACANAGRPGA